MILLAAVLPSAPALFTKESDNKAVLTPSSSPGRQTWATVTPRRSAGSRSQQKMLLISAACASFHRRGPLILWRRASGGSGGYRVEGKEASVKVCEHVGRGMYKLVIVEFFQGDGASSVQ